MKIASDWLEELVTPLPAADELAEILTMRGLEIESVEPAGPDLKGILVGKVVSCEMVRDTSLRKCRVDVGERLGCLDIVCGAHNVKKGMKVAVAPSGTPIGAVEIQTREIEGVRSEGMICSEQELGLGSDHSGILVLDRKMREGAQVRQALRLDASVLDVAITPNRGDCLSVLGTAREIKAGTGGRLKKIKTNFNPALDEKFSASISDDAAWACPLYGCVAIRGVSRADSPSPLWLRERLRRCGIRPISASVDITNYVMMTCGQPLHAFDLCKINGGIHVRFPVKGESLLLLDGKHVQLEKGTLVIADEKAPVALGGVMGGMDSGVGPGTSDILLEGAFFLPEAVRGKTRIYNLNSEAAFRFERGVDFTLPPIALNLAARMITSICGGKAGPVSITRKGALPSRPPIRMNVGMFERHLGLARSISEVRKTLKKMDFLVEAEGKTLTVTPPSHRFDITIGEDLVEEVARDYGYDNIPVTMPRAEGHMLSPDKFRSGSFRLKRRLAEMGYHEVVTYAFVSEEWESSLHGNSDPVRLSNPISDEATVMRSSLLGGLVDRARHNHSHRQLRLQIFEVGRCFPSQDAIAGEQPEKIAGLCYGSRFPDQWAVPSRESDFYDVKADVENLLPANAEFRECTGHPAMHPGKCAEVVVKNHVIGHVGSLHPRLVQRFELPESTHVFEFPARSAMEQHGRRIKVERVSKLPLVYRDLSVAVKPDVPAGEILRQAKSLEKRDEVRFVELFDSYVPKEDSGNRFKRLGIRIYLQGVDRTLAEPEIVSIMEEMEELLLRTVGAKKTT